MGRFLVLSLSVAGLSERFFFCVLFAKGFGVSRRTSYIVLQIFRALLRRLAALVLSRNERGHCMRKIGGTRRHQEDRTGLSLTGL